MPELVADDGCRLAWRIDGPDAAPVLLLSNSLGTTMDMWEPQMPEWSRRYRVLRYDSRGHGNSDAPAGAYSIDRLGRDVCALLDGLELGRVHFCGLSKGGMVGQWLAVHAPERLDHLILANTSAFMGPPEAWQDRIEKVLSEGMDGLAEASIGRWFTAEFVEAQPDRVAPIRAMLVAADPIGYAGCCAAIRDMDQRPTAKLNEIPTLVISGARDPATPLEHGSFLADQAARGRLAMLDAAHLSNVEVPAEFAALVSDFLAV